MCCCWNTIRPLNMKAGFFVTLKVIWRQAQVFKLVKWFRGPSRNCLEYLKYIDNPWQIKYRDSGAGFFILWKYKNYVCFIVSHIFTYNERYSSNKLVPSKNCKWHMRLTKRKKLSKSSKEKPTIIPIVSVYTLKPCQQTCQQGLSMVQLSLGLCIVWTSNAYEVWMRDLLLDKYSYMNMSYMKYHNVGGQRNQTC